MPVRQGNQRETASQKGSDYSDAVIKFVEYKGYFLDARAEDSGEGEDLVFIPKAGNRARVVAESKFRSGNKRGFSPNDYVGGLAERFYQWEEGAYEGYEFYLFTPNSSNAQLWKDLFHFVKDDKVESFFEKMKQQCDGMYLEFLERHEASRFKRFLENSYIYLDYEIGDLERIASRVSETQEYEYNPYAINYKPIPEPGIHKTNLLHVQRLPQKLYKIPAVDGLTTRQFYSHNPNDTLPVHFHDGCLYSLLHPDELDPPTKQMCEVENYTAMSFEEYATKSPSESEVNTSKVLIRGLVTMIAGQVGAEANRERRDTRIYMPHDRTDDDDVKIDGKWAAQLLDTGEVRHRSVTVFVKSFGDEYYVGLYPTQEFTKDGRNLVSGARKKHLSDRFNPAAHPQNDRKSKTVEMWLSKLALAQNLTRFELPSNLQRIRIQRVDDLVLEDARPPKTGTERNDLVEEQLANKSVDTEEP